MFLKISSWKADHIFLWRRITNVLIIFLFKSKLQLLIKFEMLKGSMINSSDKYTLKYLEFIQK